MCTATCNGLLQATRNVLQSFIAFRDLLNAKKTLPLRMNKSGEEDVPDAVRLVVDDLQSVQKVFMKANQQRATSNHALNDMSSRSHALFLLDVYQQVLLAAGQGLGLLLLRPGAVMYGPGGPRISSA